MKKSLFVLAVILFAVNFTKAQDEGGSVQDFTITNNTGFVIYDLYVSPADQEDWEEDILGVEMLEDGEAVEVSFSGYGDEECLFDVMIGDTEGNSWWLENVDLCSIHELEFTSSNRKDGEE